MFVLFGCRTLPLVSFFDGCLWASNRAIVIVGPEHFWLMSLMDAFIYIYVCLFGCNQIFLFISIIYIYIYIGPFESFTVI